MTYSTVRFGVYEELKTMFPSKPLPGETVPQPPSMLKLLAASSFAGFLGGFAGNPGDVLNVRMQSDLAKPPEQRRNYKHALDGLIRMTREEGIRSLFRGVGPNSMRAVLMTSSQLASYDAFKSVCLEKFKMKDNLSTHFVSSLAAGFVATTVCSPVDVIKTRIMNAPGRRSIAETLKIATQREGWLWMFRGWVPSFVRLGPQTILTMVFFEQHKKFWRNLVRTQPSEHERNAAKGQHHN